MINALQRINTMHLLTLVCLTSGFLAPSVAQTVAPATTNAAATPPITPFQYVPSKQWKEPDPSKVIKRLGAALSVETFYREGNYVQAAKVGLPLLEASTGDDELRLFIANSLAWTGRLKEARTAYNSLSKGDLKADADLGIANINRWEGKDHLALIIYKSILKNEPENADAKEGLRLALREVRPRATVSLGGSKDSAGTIQRYLILNARWRDETNASIWEIESRNDRVENALIRTSSVDLTVRYHLLETPFKPRFELGVDKNNFYGNVGIELDVIPLKLDFGRVNWGKSSVNPRALASGLSAMHVGAQLNLPTAYGKLFAVADINKVSDGNTIISSSARFTPSWQPLGKNIKFFGGFETRSAKFASLSYWSPTEGYGSGYVGVSGEWGDSDWDINTSAQVGTRLYGEAGRNWGASLSAKRWISTDIALGMSLWAMASRRGTQEYSVRSANFTVEKLW